METTKRAASSCGCHCNQCQNGRHCGDRSKGCGTK